MATMTIPSRAYGAKAKRARPQSFMSWVHNALKAARQREADAIVARAMNGRWTDQLEREVNAKLTQTEMNRIF
ncbi:MAG: hypothetical protein ACK5JM_06145 [Rhodoblastus sp.]